MKAEKLIYSMNDIRDEYVTEYAEKAKSVKTKEPHHFRTWGIIAACLALVAALIPLTIFHVFSAMNSRSISEIISGDLTADMLKNFDSLDNIKLEDLTPYPFQDFVIFLRGRNNYDETLAQYAPYMNSYWSDLRMLNSVFPVEHIDIADENTIYIVYKLERDNGDTVFAYCLFFKELIREEDRDENQIYEIWKSEHEVYFADTELSSKDFDVIEIGSHADEISRIDNAVSFEASHVSLLDHIDAASHKASFTSYRLLKDGIMLIRSEAYYNPSESKELPELEDYTVVEKNFYPYGSKIEPSYLRAINAPAVLEDLPKT